MSEYNLRNLPRIKFLLEHEFDRDGYYHLVELMKNGVIIQHYEINGDKIPQYIENPQYKELLVSQLEYNAVKDLERLQSITIEDNKVIRIILVNCCLTSLPESLGNLVNLKELDLSGNDLISLPKSLGNFVNLQWLNIENNDFKEPLSQNEEKIIKKLKKQGCKVSS